LYQELRDGGKERVREREGERNNVRISFSGLDDLLAKHIAYLFIRDPLILYNTNLEQDPETDTNHYEVNACNAPNLLVLSYFLFPTLLRYIHIQQEGHRHQTLLTHVTLQHGTV